MVVIFFFIGATVKFVMATHVAEMGILQVRDTALQ